MVTGLERNLKFQEAQWLLNNHQLPASSQLPNGPHEAAVTLPQCLATRVGLP